MGGGGLYGCFRNRGCQLASRSVLNDFTDDALTITFRQFIPKWHSPDAETVLVTLRASLLMELIGVAA